MLLSRQANFNLTDHNANRAALASVHGLFSCDTQCKDHPAKQIADTNLNCKGGSTSSYGVMHCDDGDDNQYNLVYERGQISRVALTEKEKNVSPADPKEYIESTRSRQIR